MKREILIQGSQRETRVAILEDDRLVELLVDRPELQRSIGNIYRGKVDAVLPGIQAAFVDIGAEKSAFLHASDLIEPDEDDDEEEGSGNGNGRRGHGHGRGPLPNIQDHVKRGETILVQVTKEPISTKGPRVTTQISLPGRYLVFMPHASRVGVSRKIADRAERSRLRQALNAVLPKDSGGVIVRTVAEGVAAEDLTRELTTLLNQWQKITRKAGFVRPPALVQREASLASGIIRDLFSEKVDHLWVDSKQLYNEIRKYLEEIDPSLLERMTLHEGDAPLFDKFAIEQEIATLHRRRVELPTGGYLIIEPTEALVSIDVNTGRYTGKKDPEKTVFKTNVEAAGEVARQLRLRDIGGIIVIDFIDMDTQSNRDKVLQELRAHLGRDRARTRAFHVSDLGLIEMTRQRVRPSLYQAMTAPCPSCAGTGRVFKPEVVLGRLERALRRVGTNGGERQLTVRLHPEVALHLLEEEPGFLKALRKGTGIDLEIRDDPVMGVDEFRLVARPAGRDVTEKYWVA